VFWRLVGTSAAILGGLALLGTLAGPPWNPEPVRDHLVSETADTSIGNTQAGIRRGRIHEVGTFAVRTTEVTIRLDGYVVSGLLREPIGAGDALLGITFVHGAGTGRADEAFIEQAEQLTSAGIVTLVPDKRLDNYSIWHRDYEAMAYDYLHSVEFLRRVEGVDPARVGVYGESEGTWIVPVMQAKDPRIAFTVLASAPVVEPRAQAAFAVDNYLRTANVPDQVFRAIPRALGIPFPLGILDYADFDVVPWLRQQSAPLLVVYGATDPSMPIDQGARVIIAETAIGGRDAPVTVRFYDGADHGLRVDGLVVPELSRDIAAWAQGLPETAAASPRVAGAQPEQVYVASSVPSPVWWLNGNVVFGSVLAGIILLLLGPIIWMVVGIRRRMAVKRSELPVEYQPAKLARGVPLMLIGLAIGSVTTLVALVAYIIVVAGLALSFEQDTLRVHGGWVGVRVLGAIAVVFLALLVNRARGVRDDNHCECCQGSGVGLETETGEGALVLHGWPAHFTLWTVMMGSTVLLLWLAYWGVFQLGI